MSDSDYLVMLDGCEPFVLRFYCTEAYMQKAIEYIKTYHKAFRKHNQITSTKDLVDAALKLFNKETESTIGWAIYMCSGHIIKEDSMPINKGCEEGICPMCGAELIYDGYDVDGGRVVYDVTCTECDFQGVEVYNMIYDHTEGEE